MISLRSLASAAAITGISLFFVVSTPQQAVAVTCPCAPVCQICVQCVQSVSASFRGIVNTLSGTLSSAQSALDEAISLGFEAQDTSRSLASQQIVAAHQAHGQTVAAGISTDREAELRLYEALKEAFESLSKSRMIAEDAYRTANDHGPENVSRVSSDVAGMQMATVVQSSRADDPTLLEGDEPVQVTANFMLDLVNDRADTFYNDILREDVSDANTFEHIGAFISDIDAGFSDRVLREETWGEGVAVRRAMAVPPGVQGGIRDSDLTGIDQDGYWRISTRARTAAEFLAWEMAIRSEIATDSGKTSLLNFVQSTVQKSYGTTEALMRDANSSERTLLNTISAQQSVANLLDMLILEAESYGNSIEAAKVGFYNDEALQRHYGSSR